MSLADKTSRLLLQDGSFVDALHFGAPVSVSGELVFQTGMVGYPESLTDPSYRGQILVLTFPLVGNYGVPSLERDMNKLLKYFESSKIHIAGLVIGFLSHDFSHYMAKSSLDQWLKEQGIPGLHLVDTRMLTKKIRTSGSLLAKLLVPGGKQAPVNPKYPHPDWIKSFDDVEWVDPNVLNLVEQVSTKTVETYKPEKPILVNGKPLTILCVDVGMKYNQIRCFVNRGVTLKVVPWNHDFTSDEYDGLFISNGPGDPTQLSIVIERLRRMLDRQTKPIFGICLGHQLLALASGAKTEKLKFGNRGHNIPCTNMLTGRCYITSQNHGFAVKVTTLAPGWKEYFVNANDGSNEGIIHETLPYFSVQFHPESTPGPWDTEYLFDDFIQTVKECATQGKLVKLAPPPLKEKPARHHPRKVLILGSGGLSIGQAGEFDYSGSQAIKALKEEGIYTVLINPNIATIQTSRGLADKVYFLPVTPDFVRKVIKHEKPDGIYCTFGGQTALNVGVKLKDEFEGLGVKVLGTPIHSIEITEDRELFSQSLAEIGEKTATSFSAVSTQEALEAADKIGYPVIVRAAYALGGLGSGFAENPQQLKELCLKAFAASPQVLVERSMKGWKEIEYEVVRDAYDNCITVCNMENFDPLGIHTGDSIVVAPSQTLSDEDYMMLRRTAVNVIRHIGVIGECNIQYALNPNSKEYCIIEVNARLSRSSALASKATGYPLAFVAAKLGLGIPLTEVKNSVTKKTIACFEPSLDYCVVKIPRWDLKKFQRVSTKISSSMKSVGEVMAIGRNFEETFQKAIRAVEYSFIGFHCDDEFENVDEELRSPTDQRVFAIRKALDMGYSVDKIWEMTRIDKWFLTRLKRIADLDKELKQFNPSNIPRNYIQYAKQIGFSDRQIAKCLSTTELALRKIRKDMGITPFVKQIDTVAAEFPAYTNYLYTTYNASEHDVKFEDQGIMVLGSGVYRIGSSVEFDWCAVRCIRTLRQKGFKTIMVNYNPETVSTDYDEADKLYFETLTLERVLDIYELENASGIIVSMGGQTPNNIALNLYRENVKILGTSPEMIDNAENRYKFSRMCDKIGVDQPRWKELTSADEASAFCNDVGYPVLVRPSYVLSGAGMTVVHSENDLHTYLQMAGTVSREFPVVISKFIEEAKEIEMDAVAHDGKLVMHVVTEHVENAGVHSGDATLILPPQDLDPETVQKIEVATAKIASALNVTGPFNIQFIAKNNEIKVIECNVRASRSFPFVSKVLGVDLIELATNAITNQAYEAYPPVTIKQDYVAVKVPQFSFSRLQGADPILGVEMASTGEVACFGQTKYEAYLKALIATGFTLPKKNILISIGSFKEKLEFLPSVQKLHQLGYALFATAGTADYLSEHDIPCKYLEAMDETEDQNAEYSLNQHLSNNLIDLYINLPSRNKYRRPASYMSRGYRTRRMAVDMAVPLITNVKCAKLFVEALSRNISFDISANDYQTSHEMSILPGLVNCAPLTLEQSSDCIKGGITYLAHVEEDGKAYTNYSLGGKFAFVRDTSLQNLESQPNSWIVEAKDLAQVLFVAGLNGNAVHVTNVLEKDLPLLLLAKQKGQRVTFDVAVQEFEKEWPLQYLDEIDCISSTSDLQDFLPQLLTLEAQGKLTLEDITEKASTNPRRIFDLSQDEDYVEVELGRTYDSNGKRLNGFVHRVVLNGTTVFLDGNLFEPVGQLKDRKRRMSIEKSPRAKLFPEKLDLDRKKSLFAEKPEAERKKSLFPKSPIPPQQDPKRPVGLVQAFYNKHIISVQQFQRADLHVLFGLAQEMKAHVEKQGKLDLLNGKVLCCAFYEPSTRTSSSFETAMVRLGGQVVSINQITSSIAKGESLGDTVRTLASYGDLIVMRHPQPGSLQQAAKFSPVPVISAGDGIGEHPTQALLDTFTIREELGTVNGLTITIVGDLKHGRTVHSLVKLLCLYQVKINYVSPESLKMPRELIEQVGKHGIQQVETQNIDQVIENTDVLYVTRIQKERFEDLKEYERVKDNYIVTNALLQKAKTNMIVMHPLPRINEIDQEVDFDPRAAYFRQMRYGLYVRMALLALVMGRSQ
ncbi:hypothetical protein EDD86DRAFT_214113 [Gorgonomyces haynaldii]|nr:hypothetical protein EDD86DRAFT_214113 [Gorgonomyces haynaldii]